jgi:hypothetical protein
LLTVACANRTWERYTCETDCANFPETCISEELIRTTADAMAAEGLVVAAWVDSRTVEGTARHGLSRADLSLVRSSSEGTTMTMERLGAGSGRRGTMILQNMGAGMHRRGRCRRRDAVPSHTQISRRRLRLSLLRKPLR